MRRIQLFLLGLWMAGPFSVSATGDSLNYLTLKDTIFLSIGNFNEKIFEHQIERKQTLYSLAKFYGLSIEELYFYNSGLRNQGVSVGQKIRVPIPNRAIIRYEEALTYPYYYVPVYYVAKKGDTMYRIAKNYFRMPIEVLLTRNRMMSEDLKPGHLIFVGWMSIEGIPEELRQSQGGPLARKNNALKKVFQGNSYDKKETEHQGVASWNKDSDENGDLYALHDHAPINSIIEINNPIKNRTVYAKVIGRLPESAQSKNIIVIVSPLSAKLLGAVDPSFFIRVKYHK